MCRAAMLASQPRATAGASLNSNRPGSTWAGPELAALLSLRSSARHSAEDEVARILSPALGTLRSNPKLITVMLNCLAQSRRADLAERVLSTLCDNKLEVNVFHCSAVISSLGKSGAWPKALSLLWKLP
ncbi:unnamed protein product, partial [Polarella glacialis]